MHDKAKLRVHVWDRDPINALMLTTNLKSVTDLEVETFANSAQGLISFNSNPDVVLIDYGLSSAACETGLDLIYELKRRNPRVRFILISESYQREVMFRLLNDTSISYLCRNTGRFQQYVTGMINDLVAARSRDNGRQVA